MFRMLPMAMFWLVMVGVAPAGAATADEVTATYTRFVEAQNARDEAAVSGLLRDGPDFLWVTTTGVTVWGHDDAMQRFRRNWQGTWKLEPQLKDLRVVEISPGVALLHTPLIFTFALPGKEAHPALIKWSGVFTQSKDGWHIASILLATMP